MRTMAVLLRTRRTILLVWESLCVCHSARALPSSCAHGRTEGRLITHSKSATSLLNSKIHDSNQTIDDF